MDHATFNRPVFKQLIHSGGHTFCWQSWLHIIMLELHLAKKLKYSIQW